MRVRQTTEVLTDLLRSAKSGIHVPAAFQRPYVWRESDVEDLWESIAMGLPTGSFLLWRPSVDHFASHAKPMLGPIGVTPGRHSSLILDGQNRLATLAWSTFGHETHVPAGTPGTDVWRNGRILVADPYERRIAFVDEDAPRRPLTMPMKHMGSSLSAWMREAWDGGSDGLAEVQWIESVEAQLHSARAVVTMIEDATPDEAKTAFLRISRAGVPMSSEDFDAAFAWRAAA